jgi:hypothetical protein
VTETALTDGLRNMRQRMDEIGGIYRIQSRVGQGTEIIVELPWPRALRFASYHHPMGLPMTLFGRLNHSQANEYNMIKISIIEDQRDMRESLVACLGSAPGLRCVGAHASGGRSVAKHPQ